MCIFLINLDGILVGSKGFLEAAGASMQDTQVIPGYGICGVEFQRAQKCLLGGFVLLQAEVCEADVGE